MFTGHIAANDELRTYAVPLKPRPYRQGVGLRPTQRWLLPGPDSPAQVAYKQQLWSRGADGLIGVLPTTSARQAARRAAQAVAAGAGLHLPEPEGFDAPDSDLGALVLVASSISEDLCVMSREAGRWQLVGAAVFFPSHWSPVSKLGLGLEAIHAPVPDYSRIAGATEQAFERIAASEGVWERFNWTLTADGELCHTTAPSQGVGVSAPPDSAEELWLRVERQTLTALDADLVVFGIRTFLTPLPALIDSERQALGEAISGVSGDLAEYRSWLGYREAVSRWVQGR